VESKYCVTMSGLSWEQAIAKLKEALPESAYKAIEGSKFGGTDISPAWLIEKVTDIFGPCGIGWTYTYDQGDAEVKQITKTTKKGEVYTVWAAWLKRMELQIQWTIRTKELEGPTWAGTILSTGYSEGDNPAYALRGAVTNALGSAFSKLCWQVHIYKGERVERRASSQARPIAQAQDERQPQDLPKNGTPRPYAPEKVRDTILARTREHAKAKYSDKQRGFLRGGMAALFAGQEDIDRRVHTVFGYLFEKDSGKYLTDPQWAALADWLQIKQDSGGELRVSELAVTEAQAIVTRRMSELGQEALFPSN